MTWRNRLTGVVILFTVGCTPMMYGVPLETWETLNEAQRLEAINGYNQRQIALQQARAEAAKARAAALEVQRQREAEEARARQLRVDSVYRGEGQYGDLLRVTISGGDLNFSGKQRPYESISFKIAEGEIKKLQAIGDKNRRATLVVSYLDGTLVIDDPGAGSRNRRGVRLGYDSSWGQGKSYGGIVSDGPLRLRGADVAIQIASEHPPVVEEKQPQIIIVQQPAPSQTIIVKERPRARADQKVIVVNSPPVTAVPPRQVIVTRPEPQKTIIINKESKHIISDQRGDAVKPAPRIEEAQHSTPRIVPAEDVLVQKQTVSDRRQVVEENRRENVREDRRSDRQSAVATVDNHLKITLKLKGKGLQKNTTPIVFAIGAGETVQIPMDRGQASAKVLLVGYQDGILYVDGEQSRPWKQSKATALTYDAGWAKGRSYQISTAGPARIKGCEIFVQETL